MSSFRYVVSGFLLSIISGLLIDAHAQTVNVTVSNIKSNQGQIIIAVFKDQQGFKDEKPVSRQKFPKSAVTKGVLKVTMEVPAGTYGLALVDDENNSGKMEKNMLGIPKEGVGFSNFYLSGMSKPTFHDFKFEVKPPSVAVECKIRYF